VKKEIVYISETTVAYLKLHVITYQKGITSQVAQREPQITQKEDQTWWAELQLLITWRDFRKVGDTDTTRHALVTSLGVSELERGAP
jgi:hypothetical protein